MTDKQESLIICEKCCLPVNFNHKTRCKCEDSIRKTSYEVEKRVREEIRIDLTKLASPNPIFKYQLKEYFSNPKKIKRYLKKKFKELKP